jgi:hypothetical protein
MFLRAVKAAGGKGVQHEYVRLVESYREGSTTKQHVVCNLGRKDLLAAHLSSSSGAVPGAALLPEANRPGAPAPFGRGRRATRRPTTAGRRPLAQETQSGPFSGSRHVAVSPRQC